MKPYTLTIRFRETDEYEAEVGAFMKNLSKHTDKSKKQIYHRPYRRLYEALRAGTAGESYY